MCAKVYLSNAVCCAAAGHEQLVVLLLADYAQTKWPCNKCQCSIFA